MEQTATRADSDTHTEMEVAAALATATQKCSTLSGKEKKGFVVLLLCAARGAAVQAAVGCC